MCVCVFDFFVCRCVSVWVGRVGGEGCLVSLLRAAVGSGAVHCNAAAVLPVICCSHVRIWIWVQGAGYVQTPESTDSGFPIQKYLFAYDP